MKRTIIEIDEAACTGCGLCAQANASANRSPGPTAASRLRLPQKSSCKTSASPDRRIPANATLSPARSRNCPRRKRDCRADRHGSISRICASRSP